MGRLTGKRALITGATSGIGLAAARLFLAEGAALAITGRSAEALDQAARALGGDVQPFVSDAGCLEDQTRLAAALAQHWPSLDIAYLNAGDVTHQPVADWNEEAFDRVIGVNLKGPFFLIQALLPLLADPSSIILCGSVSAHIGLPQSSVYAASKAGLMSLARTLSGELAPRGIRVNALVPGPTETSALGKLGLAPDKQDALREEIRHLVPIGRMGDVLELAAGALFLASDESRFMVGTELLMDGGVRNL